MFMTVGDQEVLIDRDNYVPFFTDEEEATFIEKKEESTSPPVAKASKKVFQSFQIVKYDEIHFHFKRISNCEQEKIEMCNCENMRYEK